MTSLVFRQFCSLRYPLCTPLGIFTVVILSISDPCCSWEWRPVLSVAWFFLRLPSSPVTPFYMSARAAENSVLSYSCYPDSAFPWVTTLLWFGFYADWLLGPNMLLVVCCHAFWKFTFRCSLLKSMLSIKVDLRGIRGSFRSFTYVRKLKPCISLSWWSFSCSK